MIRTLTMIQDKLNQYKICNNLLKLLIVELLD